MSHTTAHAHEHGAAGIDDHDHDHSHDHGHLPHHEHDGSGQPIPVTMQILLGGARPAVIGQSLLPALLPTPFVAEIDVEFGAACAAPIVRVPETRVPMPARPRPGDILPLLI